MPSGKMHRERRNLDPKSDNETTQNVTSKDETFSQTTKCLGAALSRGSAHARLRTRKPASAGAPPAPPLARAMAHIAGLRMNLSHESWSETAADEVKLESELNAEEAARLKAVKARKAAEKARREADEAKQAQEVRYRIRQEEKARFTDQQRQWWDEEARHRAQGNDADYMAERMGRSTASAHEDLVETQTKLIAKVERSEKIRMERFHEDLEKQERRRREAEALDQRDAAVAHLEEVNEALRQTNMQAQHELAEETRKLAEQEASKTQEKFKLGEDERKKKEADRQEREVTLINSKLKTEEHKQALFVRDEAARATLKQRKDTIAKEKMQQGKKKQQELVDEIKKAEAEAKRKKVCEGTMQRARASAQPRRSRGASRKSLPGSPPCSYARPSSPHGILTAALRTASCLPLPMMLGMLLPLRACSAPDPTPRRAKDEEKKAFHQAQRKKQAESTLITEKNKRLAEERKAAELLREVELAKAETEHAKERAAMASGDLKKKKGTASASTASAIATTKSQVESRTTYESKMRAQFGSGQADPTTGMLKVW